MSCGVFRHNFGALSGYYGNVCDNIIMRAMDILLAIPNLLLAISIAATLGNGIGNLILAIELALLPDMPAL